MVASREHRMVAEKEIKTAAYWGNRRGMQMEPAKAEKTTLCSDCSSAAILAAKKVLTWAT